jgi:hypothetical protein
MTRRILGLSDFFRIYFGVVEARFCKGFWGKVAFA